LAVNVKMRETRATEAPEAAKPSTPKSADGSVTVKDALGRTLQIKKLSLLEEMDLLAAAGAERSGNARWMQYATVVCCVRKIDEDFIHRPQTSRILQSNIQQVGAEGFAAVVKALAAELPDDIDALDGDALATAKN
jgi:hypothetical protein